MIVTKPDSKEHTLYHQQYIDEVPENDLMQALVGSKNKLMVIAGNIPNDKADYRYAEGKWNIKEVLGHINDTERIFAYRALCFARNDKAMLPGFDEEKYAPESNAANRTISSIIDEFHKVRDTTIALFNSFSEDMFMRTGTANGNQISVRAIGFIIAGHSIHHMNFIKEKYLSQPR